MNFGLNLLKNNKLKTGSLMLLEIIFWFLFVLILVFSSVRLAENYEILNMEGSFNPDEFIDAKDEDLINLQEKLKLVDNSLDNILRIYGLSLLILFLLFGVFKSVQWMLSFCVIKKQNFKFDFKYLFKFYLLLLFWICFFVVFSYLINLIFRNPYLFLLILFLFYVCSSVSFVCLLKGNKLFSCVKKSFKTFFNKKILVFLFLIGIFLISTFVFSFFSEIILISILGLIWLLLLISWSRLFILLNLENF